MKEKILAWLIKGFNGLIGHLEFWVEEFGTMPEDSIVTLRNYVSRINVLCDKPETKKENYL